MLVVEVVISLSRAFSVPSAVPGNTSRRSVTTEVCTEWLERICPATNSPSSAIGITPTSML